MMDGTGLVHEAIMAKKMVCNNIEYSRESPEGIGEKLAETTQDT